jgi:hypothetical protein
MKEETKVKPIVHFTNGATIVGAGNGRLQAHVYGVEDHPLLGAEAWVTTSLVQEVTKDADDNIIMIETQNTIYKKTEAKYE